MFVEGLESVAAELEKPGFFIKFLLSYPGAVFFSGTIQHRDMKQHGLSYEDDYLGNAMAATITPPNIDVRDHRAFADNTVADLMRPLLSAPEMSWATQYTVRYQGRPLRV